MIKLHHILLFFIALVLVGHVNCGLRGDVYREQIVSDPPPLDWKRVDLRYFSFYLPPDIKESEVQGIDSFVWQAVSDSARLTIDLGAHSNDLTSYLEWPGFHQETLVIDSRQARICTFRHSEQFMDSADGDRLYIAAAYFADIGRGDQLTLWFASNRPNDQQIAKRVFKSIKFK